jgi:hypothetical protein
MSTFGHRSELPKFARDDAKQEILGGMDKEMTAGEHSNSERRACVVLPRIQKIPANPLSQAPEGGDRAVEPGSRAVSVGFAYLQIRSQDRGDQLHHFRVIKYFCGSSVKSAELGLELRVWKGVKRPVGIGELWSLTAGYEKVDGFYPMLSREEASQLEGD